MSLQEPGSQFGKFVESMAGRTATAHQKNVVDEMEKSRGFYLALTPHADFVPLVAAWMVLTKNARYVVVMSRTHEDAVCQFKAVRRYLSAVIVKEWNQTLYLEDAKIEFISRGHNMRGSRYKDTRPDLLIIDPTTSFVTIEDGEWLNGDVYRSLSRDSRVLKVRDR